MAGRQPTRAEDERHLEWLSRRNNGEDSTLIGLRAGVSGETVRVATNRIRAADLEYSVPHEKRSDVKACYWVHTTGKKEASRNWANGRWKPIR